MYKYETHLHTREGSACASSYAFEMVDKYKELGYTGIIITDHFFNGNSSVDRSLSWEEQVDGLCKGYENAKMHGLEVGVDVFFGFEFSECGNDFLIYGLDKEWLKSHPEIMSMRLAEYLKFVHQNDGFVVHAHPFREAGYIDIIKLMPYDVDAVETINASHSNDIFNERADWYAESYGIPKVSGSDSHTTDRVFGGGISVNTKFESIFDYLKAIKRNDIIELHSRYPEFK